MSVTASWKTEPLGEVVTFDRAVVSPQQAGARQYVGLEDVQSDGSLSWKEDQRLPVSDKFAFDRDHILYGKLRPYLRKVARPTFDGMCSTDILPLRPKLNINRDYLYHFLRTEEFAQQATARSAGVNLPRISPSVLAEFPVALPTTLSEQCRIAAILDKADAIRARRRAALADADALARATFLHLFGDLVTNPMGWETRSLGELIADGPQNGLYRPASDYGSGTPILRIDSFKRGRTSDLTQLKRLRIDAATRARWTLNADDIVINRVNSPEHLGKSALIPQLTEPTVFESNMMRFSVDITRADPRFLIDQLQTAYIRRQIARRAKPAVNQSSINQEDVRSFEVRLPPLPRQQAYARFVTELEVSRTRHCTGLADADALYASLAARAFRGKL